MREDLRRERIELPALRASVSEARRRASRLFNRWELPEHMADTARLVISELVTNAVVHTRSETIFCLLHARSSDLEIQVSDEGTGLGMPRACEAHADEERGRGLQLVGALTDRWGVAAGEQGSGWTVWAVLSATSG